MKYIVKLADASTASGSITPSVQYKQDDCSIYIVDPMTSTVKTIALDGAKDKMTIRYTVNGDTSTAILAGETLYANNDNHAWAPFDSSEWDYITEMHFNPYFKPVSGRNAFRGYATLSTITGLNTHAMQDMYGLFSNYQSKSPLIEDVTTVDGGGNGTFIIKTKYTGGPVSCEYMFSNNTNAVNVEVYVPRIGACRNMFENCSNLNNVTLTLGGTNPGTNRVDSMFKGCSLLKTVSAFSGKSVTRVDKMFDSCDKLEYFGGLVGLGESFTYNAQYPGNCQLDLSASSSITGGCVHDLVANLGQIPASENIDYAWVKFGIPRPSDFTDAEMAAATAKGWEIKFLEPDPEE